ncbi:hypothetical protein T07_1759 [Trichinella nelsoni]|uniref:Uncharacterized protein n=1 Tax=Trichinella nelsoni TaxID=6336 RepID=A0A0V0S5L2_9BILA|nr:hypothetical protein T07_1759 [Trichinella nelsoni]
MTTIAVCKEMSKFDFTNTCSTTPNCKRIATTVYDKSQHFEVISHNGNLKGKQKSTIEKIPAKRTTRLAFCHVSR